MNLISFTGRHTDSKWILQLKSLKDELEISLADIEGLGEVTKLDHSTLPDVATLESVVQGHNFSDDSLNTLAELINDDSSEGFGSLRQQVSAAVIEAGQAMQSLEGERKAREAEIAQIDRDSRLRPPSDVEEAIEAIEAQMPAASPRIVGNHIDIPDSNWQNAIEGYLGRARYAIIVNPGCEADAIRLVRGMRGRASVVQGEKARRDAAKRHLADKSIVQLMEFNDEYVRGYIEAQFGGVLQVENEQELRKTARGLTRDGMGSGSYRMYKSWEDDSKLICGKAARQKRKNALSLQIDEIASKYAIAKEAQGLSKQAQHFLESIQPLNLTENLRVALIAARARETAQKMLESVDTSGVEELEQNKQDLIDQIEAVNKVLSEAEAGRGQCHGELYGREGTSVTPAKGSLKCRMRKIAALNERLEDDALACQVNYVDWRRKVDEGFEEGPILDKLKHLGDYATRELLNEYQDKIRSTRGIQTAAKNVSDALAEYNATPVESARVDNPLSFIDEWVHEDSTEFLDAGLQARQQVSDLSQHLSNNLLIKHKDTLDETQRTFDETFTRDLVTEILSRINGSAKTLKALNAKLKNARFADEYYQFEWSRNKEFSEYLRCFTQMVDIHVAQVEGDDLLSGTPDVPVMDERDLEVRESLMNLLLQENDERAQRELMRISDYRNYHDYEIMKYPDDKEKIPLSTYGTGSGGQLETPFYVIMAAAYQATMGFGESGAHLRSVVIDESFKNLDERRSRDILRYLAGDLGLQILFIMPSSKSGPYTGVVTHQFVVQKMPDLNPPAGSQLKTRVEVDDQKLNTEAIDRLVQARKDGIRSQLGMDFMAEVLAEEKGQSRDSASV